MSLFYDFLGRRHEITHDEIHEIERSGAPHPWQEYADGHHGTAPQHLSPGLLSSSIALMDERPGATAPTYYGAYEPPKRRKNLGSLDAEFIRNFRPSCSIAQLAAVMNLNQNTVRLACQGIPCREDRPPVDIEALRHHYISLYIK
jgi:hypothetical protein